MDKGSARAILTEVVLAGADYGRLEHIEAWADLREAGGWRPDVGAMIVDNQRVDDDLLQRFPSLRVVCRYGIGYDTVDVVACTSRGIQVGITRGPVEIATAELAIALMLSSRRAITEYDSLVRQGQWSDPVSVLPVVPGLAGSRLGVVGLGRIGSLVAARALALGMTVAYHARHDSPAAVGLGATRLELDELVATSDILTLHVPLTAETTALIDARRLALMPNGAMLVNTARGGVVNEEALLAELEAGRIYAGLDVYATEPTPSDRVRRAPNTVLTPHVASATRSARLEMTRLTVENVLAGLDGRSLPDRVDEQSSMEPLA
jgi:phosphoglycerate dehydrogenase-like enzyme